MKTVYSPSGQIVGYIGGAPGGCCLAILASPFVCVVVASEYPLAIVGAISLLLPVAALWLWLYNYLRQPDAKKSVAIAIAIGISMFYFLFICFVMAAAGFLWLEPWKMVGN